MEGLPDPDRREGQVELPPVPLQAFLLRGVGARPRGPIPGGVPSLSVDGFGVVCLVSG